MSDPRAPGGPLWAITGPTGTGKSALALELCERLGGEIVSVDSAQVFIGLDIGTAKPTREERAHVPHHLIDVIDPNTQWTATAFAAAADQAIAEIRGRGKLPLLCGGTGLWLRALIHGVFQAPPIDPELRAGIRAALEARGPEALHAELAQVDPVAAARLHPRDRQRISRALEVVRQTGTPISALQAAHGFKERRYPLRALALDCERTVLAERLAERVHRMYRQGLLAEVRGLLDAGAERTGPGLGCIGYREAVQVLDGVWTEEAAIEQTIIATRQYAKRQRNWFKSEQGLSWVAAGIGVQEALQQLGA